HDADAFGTFYARHAPGVRAGFVRELRNPELAADLTAETFAEALRAVHRFRGVHAASGRAWISAIAANVLSHYLRSDRVRTSARIALVAGAGTATVAGAAVAAEQLLGGPAPPAVKRDIADVDAGLPADLRLNPDVEHAQAVASTGSSTVYYAALSGGGYCAEL